MTLPRRTRRFVDAAVAAAIALAVVITAVALWSGSDERATSSVTASPGAAPTVPATPDAVPGELHQVWELATDPQYGAVVSPYGSVVTAGAHGVVGYAVTTGARLWSYSRSNRQLCAIGSGDTTADGLSSWTGVHGVMTLFAKNGYCSQVTLLDPTTGARLYQRTSPNQDPGQLFFGAPYVGWTGSDYLELWRHDLVATIRYGNQPNPVNSNGPHLGCTFSDAAVTTDQLATIEHCSGAMHLVLNWPTPSDSPTGKDKGWDANHSQPKTTVDLPGTSAVIVGITTDRVAVLVATPSPAVVVYDSSGVETSRTAVDVSAAEIAQTAKAGITPSVVYQTRRYTLVGHHLLSVSSQTLTVPAPPPTTTAAPQSGSDVTTGGADATGSDSGAGGTGATEETVSVANPVLDWVAPDAIGLPTRVGSAILVPTAAGLEPRSVSEGAAGTVIPVQRGGYTGRVDVTAVGNMLVEVRGRTVVGLTG